MTISKSFEKPMIHFKFNLRANVRMSGVHSTKPQPFKYYFFDLVTSFLLHHEEDTENADNKETTKTNGSFFSLNKEAAKTNGSFFGSWN